MNDIVTHVRVTAEDDTGRAWASITSRLRSLGLSMSHLAQAGGVGKFREAFGKIGESFHKVREAAAPALEAFGAIAGIGAGVGIAALAESLKSAAESIQD